MDRFDRKEIKPDKIALFAMLALFPGSFFYQVSVGTGLIPAFAGGYFGVTCAALFAILATRYAFRTLATFNIQIFDALYLGFIIYFATVAAFHAFVIGNSEFLAWHFGSIIQCATVYLIFKGMTQHSNTSRNILWLSVAGMTACIFYLMEGGVFSIRDIAVDKENISSYQGFALAYLLSSIIAIANTKGRAFRIMAYPVLAYALYVNGARSEFAAFLIFIVLFEVCKSNIKVLSVLAAMSAIAAVSALLYTGAINLPENRVTRLLNLSEDNSAVVRNQISEAGFSKILESPLLGSYGNYEQGYYIHNILSVWLDLGLLGFIYFFSLIFFPMLFIGVKVMTGGKSNTDNAFMFSSMFACFALLVFGKYFTYLMLPAVLGYYSAIRIGSIQHGTP